MFSYVLTTKSFRKSDLCTLYISNFNYFVFQTVIFVSNWLLFLIIFCLKAKQKKSKPVSYRNFILVAPCKILFAAKNFFKKIDVKIWKTKLSIINMVLLIKKFEIYRIRRRALAAPKLAAGKSLILLDYGCVFTCLFVKTVIFFKNYSDLLFK